MEQTFLPLSEIYTRFLTQTVVLPNQELHACVVFCDDSSVELQIHYNTRSIYTKKLNKNDWSFAPNGILLSSKLVDRVWDFITT